jgi:hypothetical protein
MKSSIDNKCPRGASHLKTKAKKNALMEERFAQIETENRILLEKMSHIMRVSSNVFVLCYRVSAWFIEFIDTTPPYPRLILNCFLTQFKGSIDCTNDIAKYSKPKNKERQKRELQRIEKENRQILKRIQAARPTYNHKKWQEEAKEHARILSNICEFKQPTKKDDKPTVFDEDSLFGYLDLYDNVPSEREGETPLF